MNSARSNGYMSSGDCAVNWIVCPPCEGIPDALGDLPYTMDNISQAPWYDVEEEASHRFLGVHALSIDGLNDSTRTATIAEGINDGGVVGAVRHAVRQVRVRALLSALGEDALESGLAWLKAALDPDVCGTHGSSCGATDSCFFVACPPTPDQYTINTPVWNDAVTNLVTNPSFETAGAAVVTATNLATNPSFETAGSTSTVVVATNLATNPSFETTGIDMELRRNLYPTPSLINAPNTWANIGGGGTRTAGPTGDIFDIPDGVGNGGWAEIHAQRFAVTTGQRLYSSIVVEVPVGYPAVNVFWRIEESATPVGLDDGGGEHPGALHIDGPTVTINPGESKTVAIPANSVISDPSVVAVKGIIYGGAGNIPAGARIIVRNMLFELSGAPGPYFDGGTLNAGDFTYLWAGTPNASASIQNGKTVTGYSAGNGHAVSSTEWAKSRTRSIRMTPNQGAFLGDSFVFAATVYGGNTYTAKATLRIKSAFVNPDAGTGRARSIYAEGGGGSWSASSGSSPNAPGVYEHSVTFTAASDGYVRLYSGSDQATDEVWWDDFMLVEGTYTGPYFDGTAIQKARRNLHPEPQLINTIAGYTGFGDIDFTAGPDGIRLRSNSSSTIANPHQYIGSSTLKIPVSAGSPIVASVEISVAAGQPGVGVGFGLQFIDKNGGGTGPGGGAPFYGTDTFVGPGETKRALSPLIIVPPNTTAVMIQWYTATTVGLPPLAQFLFRKVIIEPATAHGAYFDGSHPVSPYLAGWDGAVDNSPSYLYDPAYSYAWTGTPDASSSTQSQTLETVAGVAPPTGGQATVLLSNDSPAHGTKVMRYTVGLTGGVALPVIDFLPTTGIVYTLIGKVRPRSRDTLVTPRIRNTTGTNILAPKDVWTDFRLTTTAGSGTITQTGLLLGGSGGHQVGDLIDIDQVMFIEGGWTGPYFDGNTVAGGDFTYGWTGAANASTSTQRSTDVAQAFAQTPAQTVRWQSPLAASERGYGARYRVVSGVVNTPLAVSDSAAILTGTTYTILGRIRPLTNEVTFRPSIRGTLTPSANKITAPVGVWTKFQATIVAGSSTMKYTGVNLDAGHKAGDIIDLDQVAIVQGNYTGDYFDGATPDSPETDYEIPDKLLVEYTWTGAADASTSTGRTGSVATVPDPVAYGTAVDLLQRTMHDVTCISGPLIEQKLHRDELWGYIVEFTVAAGTPWLFGVTREVVIPPGQIPIVVQDTPFNLVPYPSAELSSGTVIVATNYATNPSAELNAAGWGVLGSAAIPSAQLTITRSTELWSAGTASVKVLATTTGSATNSYFGVDQVVQLPGITPATRYSVNLWASASVESGTAVLSAIHFHVYWEDAAGAVLRDDPIGNPGHLVPAGGALSSKSILPPAGTTRARVAAVVAVDSFSAGAKIRLYADAAAVTVP